MSPSSRDHTDGEAEPEAAHYVTSGRAVLGMGLLGLVLALAMLTVPAVRPGFIDGPSALVISSLMLLLGLWMIRHGAQTSSSTVVLDRSFHSSHQQEQK